MTSRSQTPGAAPASTALAQPSDQHQHASPPCQHGPHQDSQHPHRPGPALPAPLYTGACPPPQSFTVCLYYYRSFDLSACVSVCVCLSFTLFLYLRSSLRRASWYWRSTEPDRQGYGLSSTLLRNASPYETVEGFFRARSAQHGRLSMKTCCSLSLGPVAVD